MRRHSISTVTLPGSLNEKLQAAAQAGFSGIELFDNDLLYFDHPARDIRARTEELGLEIVALHPFRDYEAMPERHKQKAISRAKRKFELMQELNCGLLILHANESELAMDDQQKVVDDLAELADIASGFDIVIGYMATPWARYCQSYGQAWAIIKQAQRENLKLVLDTYQLFMHNESLDALGGIPGDAIALVHLSDAPTVNMDINEHHRHFRCFPGEGGFSFTGLYNTLRTIGYENYISLEVTNDDFLTASPNQIARDGQRSILWVEEQSEAADPSASGNSQRPLLTGIEFIEFCSEGGEARWLAELLLSLGFRKTHQHRSKDVSLFRQGDVNLLINQEPESFAHSFFVRHGTSVCALGLGTDNPAKMAKRAEAYLCFPFEGRNSRDELNIPAIRSADGGLLYFVKRSAGDPRYFEVDFKCIEETTDASHQGIHSVDHIVQALSPAEFLSAQLLYRSVFNLLPRHEQDITDPHGVVTSRIMENEEGTVCFPLNASHAHETVTQRFRSRQAGSGIQQIALATDDLFAVAAKMNPLNILPIPENYYTDLDDRFDLEPGLLDRMKRHNILYDESNTGTLFHLFTRTLNGVYFEILQRSEYQGFGEANAAVRLASQAREYEKVRMLTLGYA